jgi:signal transduction histidine kinase
MSTRRTLLHKYALIFGSLILGSLLVSDLCNVFLSYNENRISLINLQSEKARMISSWASFYLGNLEQQIAFTGTHQTSPNPLAQRRTELDALRHISAVKQIILLDQTGKERWHFHRSSGEVENSMIDHAAQDMFQQVKPGKPWHSPVGFDNDSEPVLSIAMAVGPAAAAGITVVQISLQGLLDNLIHMNSAPGHTTWVIDGKGRLLAHPDLSLVLKNTDMSHLPQVQAAQNGVPRPEQAQDLSGQALISAWSPISSTGWLIFVEQPKADALHAVYGSLQRIALLLLLGAIATILISTFLVRRIMVPITALTEGAMRIGNGALDQRIEVHTGDELEQLAGQFNDMAGRLQESYINLEQKINERTHELMLQQERVELAHRHIALLSDIGRDITTSLNRDDIMQTLYRHIHGLMDLQGFGLGLYAPEQQCIVFPFAIRDEQRLPEYRREMHDPNQLAVWCVLHKKEVLINDRESDIGQYLAHFAPERESRLFKVPVAELSQSAMYAPMLLKDRVVGVISVQHRKKHAYQPFHRDMLRTLAAYAAVALDNAHAYDQLKNAQQQLVFQEKMVSLGTLTAGVAHEINNPANFAHVGAFNLKTELGQFHRFLLQLAGDDAPPELLASLQTRIDALHVHLATIAEGTVRIRDLVKDLRTFSRLDEAESKEVAIGDSLQSTINLVRMQYIGSTEIDCQLPVNPVLLCWPAQLNQVFMNLIVNACQAIEKRQQTDPTRGLLAIRSQIEQNWLLLTFEDNGGGMSDATMAHIFEPFFTTKTVGDGMGMGLSISFGIIEKHQGKLEVSSNEGQGTRFTIKLPLANGGNGGNGGNSGNGDHDGNDAGRGGQT